MTKTQLLDEKSYVLGWSICIYCTVYSVQVKSLNIEKLMLVTGKEE